MKSIIVNSREIKLLQIYIQKDKIGINPNEVGE